MRRALARAVIFPMIVLMTLVYPLWRSGFWLFNDPDKPPPGYWKEIWREWWEIS